MLLDIVPLLKNSDSNEHTYKNYRPISVTSVIARIIEKVIKKRIVTELVKKNVIPSYQYEDRKALSLKISTAQNSPNRNITP